MKHLIETTNPSGLAITEYNRGILNSTTIDVGVKGGGVNTEYVDLGLSVKWAKCNVGAKTETDYGDYFMWGSVTTNTPDACTWANAPFNGGYSEYNAGAFNQVKDSVCPNGILAKEYDAAAQIMGGDWRMPTITEFEELVNNTTKEWTQVNDVYGYKFTGSNGNYIFIPAAGYCYNGSVRDVGGSGNVWSSLLNTATPYLACNLYFYSGDCYTYDDNRCNGLCVRGVRK